MPVIIGNTVKKTEEKAEVKETKAKKAKNEKKEPVDDQR